MAAPGPKKSDSDSGLKMSHPFLLEVQLGRHLVYGREQLLVRPPSWRRFEFSPFNCLHVTKEDERATSCLSQARGGQADADGRTGGLTGRQPLRP